MKSRHAKILERLSVDGEATVQTLAESFGVSVMTIRRDLAQLEAGGELTRTHGGAVRSHPGLVEFAFKQKGEQYAKEKRAIAQEARQLIESGMTVTLDTGTTTLEVAKAIAGIPDLTVLTSSLAIASVLYGRPNISLVLAGGAVRTGSPDLSGWLTEENLKRFRVDVACIGADGVDQEGVFTTDVNVARVSQAMIASAHETVLVADHTKFEKPAFVCFASWSDIDCVVTGIALPLETCTWLENAVRTVTYAIHAR
ncbi:MAG: DeoR/GlpR family DNA-binding transcription regulator [Candidatus Hydrogenedentota bacterium]